LTTLSIKEAAILHFLLKYPKSPDRELLLARLGPKAKKIAAINLPD
jgi:hypothetical protein